MSLLLGSVIYDMHVIIYCGNSLLNNINGYNIINYIALYFVAFANKQGDMMNA